jgi:hypothetical protein
MIEIRYSPSVASLRLPRPDTRSGLAKLPQGRPFPTSLAMRPISIRGSQVTFDGGSLFNDVAGNMNQTFTAIVSQQRADGPPILAGYSDDHPRTFLWHTMHIKYHAQLMRAQS